MNIGGSEWPRKKTYQTEGLGKETERAEEPGKKSLQLISP